MTIDERGTQRVLSYFRQQPTQANSWVGRAKSGYDETLRIAQRYHEQNEAVRLAKLCFESSNC